MKKNFIYAVLAAAVLLCGCENGTEIPSETSETSQAVTTTTTAAAVTTTSETAAENTVTTVETTVPTETAAEEITVAEQEYMTGEIILLDFLEYLQKPEKTYSYVFEFYNDFNQYDFMDDFKIDGYSYQHIGGGSYNVKLICSDSICELFPNGESYWFFSPGRFCRYEEKDDVVTDYEFYEKYKDYPNYETIFTAFEAARAFSFSTDVFEADKTWFNEVQAANTHWLYHSYNPYLTIYEDGGVYPDDFRAAVKKLYNITLPLPTDPFRTDENGRIFAYCGHGGTWRYEALAGYEETESEIKVTMNFYGDEMYFYPVIQSEYTFSKNGDGSITLQKVEKLFDRGYELASGTI